MTEQAVLWTILMGALALFVYGLIDFADDLWRTYQARRDNDADRR